MAPTRSNCPIRNRNGSNNKTTNLSRGQAVDLRRNKDRDGRRTKRYIFKTRLGTPRQHNLTEERLQELVDALKEGLDEDNARKVLDSLHEMRGGLANSEHIDTVLQGGIMPLLDRSLVHAKLDVRYSAIWILTNIACGTTEQTEMVAQRLDKVVPLLKAREGLNGEVLAQALWMLANIAGDSAELRDAVVHHVSFDLVKEIINEMASAQVLENVAWLMSNVARQGPHESKLLCRDILNILEAVTKSSCCDCKVVSEVCWALLHVLHNLGEPEGPEAVKSSGIVEQLVSHSQTNCSRLCFGELVKLVADLLSSDDASCERFIEQGVLKVLATVEREEISELYYYACFALANVFACTASQFERAIELKLLAAAIHHLEHGDFEVQREAAIALCSFLGAAEPRQVLRAFNSGLVPPLVNMLRYLDPSIVYDVLASLFNLMNFARELAMEDEFLMEMRDCDVEKRLQNLVGRNQSQISELAQAFIDQFLTLS